MMRVGDAAGRRSAIAGAFAVAGLLFAGGSPARADVITLVNGNTIEGLILDENDQWIIVETPGGRMTLPMARVETIERGDPWDYTVRQGEEATRMGQWPRAVECYRTALTQMREASAEPETITEVEDRIAECEDLIRAESARIFEGMFREVEALLDRRRFEDAYDLLESAIAEAPEGAPVSVLRDRQALVLLEQAEHLLDLVETTRAMDALRRAIEHDPELAEAHRILGHELAEQNAANPAAAQELRTALEMFDADTDPDVIIETTYRLAECLEATGEHLEASEAFERVHEEAGRRFPNALRHAVDNLLRWARSVPRSEDSHAILVETLTRAHRLSPERIEPLNELGGLYSEMGRVAEAIELYRQSLEIESAQALVHERMGLLHLSVSGADPRNAQRAFLNALRHNPNLYSANCALAEIYERADQLDLALQHSDAAVQINDRFAQAFTIRGRVRRARSDTAGAIEDLLQAITLSGNTVEPRLMLGRIYAQESDLANARTQYQQVLDLYEEEDMPPGMEFDVVQAQGHAGLGDVRLREHLPHQALEEIETALELAPEFPDTHMLMGRTLVELDRIEEAEQAYLLAIDLAPEEPNTYYDLGLLYKNRMEDRRDDAVRCFREYLDRGGTDIETIQQLLDELRASR